ncbi:MAG TPA: transposase [Verrucomicrobiae bacterium]|nr:transposase [Verrucomicrobiae bacterium]
MKREGGTYFVTFRLKGCLPAEALQKFKAEREAIIQKAVAGRRPLTWHEQQEVFRWYSSRVDAYLDAGHGEAFLCENHIAPIVASAIRFHENARFKLLAWALMPNHVHVVVQPFAGWTLSQILKSWKGFTARKINEILRREGALWQSESYDHLIRDDEDMARCCRYVVENPVQAGLCKQAEEWAWSNAAVVAQVSRPAGSPNFPVRRSSCPRPELYRSQRRG